MATTHRARRFGAIAVVLAAAGLAQAQASPAPTPVADPPPLRLTAADCVRLALRNDLRLQGAAAVREGALAAAGEAGAPYDPFVRAELLTRRSRTESGSALSGAPILTDEETRIGAGVGATLQTGTEVRLDLSDARTDTNSAFATETPQHRAHVGLTVTQPLLRDFGTDHHGRRLESAVRARDGAEARWHAAVAATALAAEEAYWGCWLARAEREVQSGALDLAREELRIVEAQREAGRLAPVDVLQTRASLAAAEEVLIVAEAAARTAEERVLRFVAPPTRADDLAAYARRIEPIEAPGEAAVALDEAGSVRRALQKRPELLAARADAARATLDAAVVGRATLPRLDLVGTLGTDGLARAFGESVQDLGRGDFLSWSVGLSLEVPLGGIFSGAQRGRAEAEARRSELALRDLEVQVVLEVRETVRNIGASERRIAAARASREFSEQKLAAERDRLAQGLSTAFVVASFREQLAVARSRENRALVDHRLSAARLRRAEGTLAGDTPR